MATTALSNKAKFCFELITPRLICVDKKVISGETPLNRSL